MTPVEVFLHAWGLAHSWPWVSLVLGLGAVVSGSGMGIKGPERENVPGWYPMVAILLIWTGVCIAFAAFAGPEI